MLMIALALLVAMVFAAPAAAQDPPPGCERGEGTDADYAYCPDQVCDEDSDDADYTYCLEGEGVPSSAPSAPSAPSPRPASVVRPLAAQTLPVTGGEPAIVAAAGLAFLLAGSGLRLRAREV